MVTRSRQIKKYCGVMGMPDKNKGKRLTENIKIKIKDFYLQGENSKLCPGKKDYKNVTSKDSKTQHQKRLLLGDLKELYQSWKQENINCKVGFSTFAALRPQWCILAGASVTHSVCVCIHHQYPKLMVAPLNS